MKALIIGPEGAGKTILIASLSGFVARNRKDLVMKARDRKTSRYVAKVHSVMDQGDWPPSTRQSEINELKWNLGRKDSELHELDILDAAGQDYRAVLTDEDSTGLTQGQKNLRGNCEDADILIYVLDLQCFVKTRDPESLEEDAWLLRQFVEYEPWLCKKRILVVSKVDLYPELQEQARRDSADIAFVREFIKKHLPQHYSSDHLVEDESVLGFLPLSSTETQKGQCGGVTMRVPVKPPRPLGMGPFVDLLIKEVEAVRFNQRLRYCWGKVKEWAPSIVKMSIISAVLFGLWYVGRVVFEVFETEPCLSCNSSGSITESGWGTCSKCDGSGTAEFTDIYDWWECNSCEGYPGKGLVPVNHKSSCFDCGGDGKRGIWNDL